MEIVDHHLAEEEGLEVDIANGPSHHRGVEVLREEGGMVDRLAEGLEEVEGIEAEEEVGIEGHQEETRIILAAVVEDDTIAVLLHDHDTAVRGVHLDVDMVEVGDGVHRTRGVVHQEDAKMWNTGVAPCA
jgi:hypothetical protein